MEKAPDKFHLLPGPQQAVTNEGLFAHQDWMKSHPEAVSVITEEFLKLYREMKDNPGIIAEEREKRGLLADQPKVTADEITSFVKQGMESGLWNPEGGSEAIAQADVDFYSISGALHGPPDELKWQDFWDLGPLEAAKKELGG